MDRALVGDDAAPADLWWEALRQAFHPQPTPGTPEEWAAWAATVEHDPGTAAGRSVRLVGASAHL